MAAIVQAIKETQDLGKRFIQSKRALTILSYNTQALESKKPEFNTFTGTNQITKASLSVHNA